MPMLPPKEERGMALLRFVSQADTTTVRMGSEQAAGVEAVEPLKDLPEILGYAYNRDTGRNADEDWERIPVVIDKGVEKAGDAVQAIPDPVLSGAGFIAGGVAVLGTGGVTGVAASVGYVASSLSFTKVALDMNEGKADIIDLGRELSLEAGARTPYFGPLVEGGEFLYDSIKYKYEEINDEK